MRLLLDTHIALWAISEPERLPARAEALILLPGAEIWVSIASVWEIAIKHRRHPPSAIDSLPSGKDALAMFAEAAFALLPVRPDHIARLDDLADHHRDPFDRMLVAQAMAEPMHLLTHDAALAAYGDHVLLV